MKQDAAANDGATTHGSMPRQLGRTLALSALAAVVFFGALNFIAARRLLDDGTKQQLVGIGQMRAQSIEIGLSRLLGQVSATANDLAVVEAVDSLSASFTALESETLTGAQLEELDAAYDEFFVQPVNQVQQGVLSVDDLRPPTAAGQYLHYQYVLPQLKGDAGGGDPGSGATYEASHDQAHPYLSSLAAALGADDLLLISAETGDVVYSVKKGIDLGANLKSGTLRDSELSDAVLNQLPRVRAGEAVIADYEIYVSTGGTPEIFMAASVRRDTEIIGTLVLRLPVAAINQATGADGSWDEVGLNGGESYVVGSDLVLRSESRAWIEDPQSYLESVDDERTRSLIEFLGSPVGIQTIETEPVTTALDGIAFEGTSKNYLGEGVFSYATPIDVSGVDWVMVADVPSSAAREPLVAYGRRLGLVIALILPLAALVGVAMARRIARPIPALSNAALAVAAGERDPQLDVGEDDNDEYGDLGRRLRQMASKLSAQEVALTEEFEQKRELLLTVLPPRMVRADGAVLGTGEGTEVATVIAVTLSNQEHNGTDDEAQGEIISKQALVADQLADQQGVERIRAGADRYLFLAGLGSVSDGGDEAVSFVLSLSEAQAKLAADDDVAISLQVGLSTGPVATGLLEIGSLAFNAWGEPVRQALALSALAGPDAILLGPSTAQALAPGRWTLVPAGGVFDLDGKDMQALRLVRESTPQPADDHS